MRIKITKSIITLSILLALLPLGIYAQASECFSLPANAKCDNDTYPFGIGSLKNSGGCVAGRAPAGEPYGQYYNAGRNKLLKMMPTLAEFAIMDSGHPSYEGQRNHIQKQMKTFLPYLVNFQCRCTSNMNDEAYTMWENFSTTNSALDGGTNNLSGVEIITAFVNCPETYVGLYQEWLDSSYQELENLSCANTRTKENLTPDLEGDKCKIKSNSKGVLRAVCKSGYCYQSD